MILSFFQNFQRFYTNDLIPRVWFRVYMEKTAWIFFLKDKILTDLDNFQEPETLASQITENLEAALGNFRNVSASLNQH